MRRMSCLLEEQGGKRGRREEKEKRRLEEETEEAEKKEVEDQARIRKEEEERHTYPRPSRPLAHLWATRGKKITMYAHLILSAPIGAPRIGKEARGGNSCARKHPPPDSVPAAQGNQSASGCPGCTLPPMR